MKKIIYIIGIICLVIITILNILFTANMDAWEHITINWNSIIYVCALILISTFIALFTIITNKYLNNEENNHTVKIIRKIILVIGLMIYIVFNILWLVFVNPPVVGDQIHAANLAQTFFRGNTEEFFNNITYAGIPLRDYMQAYHQQISLAFVFSIVFRILHFDTPLELLRILNLLGNILIVFSLYKITKQLDKSYKTNKVMLFTLILTFISLPMLSTFIYGDIPSLALCLLSIYFMMKYTETNKVYYPILASIFMMIAYMMRMNSLIFIIATTIYLLLNLFKEINKKHWKENLIKIAIIAMYIFISIMPASIVKQYYVSKYNLDKSKEYPNISYILMAMEEGPRQNGWYNEQIGEHALNNLETVKDEYIEKVKSRLVYFSENIGYAFEFYTNKLASMWTENTYAAIRNNTTQENQEKLENIIEPLTFYQKAVLISIAICSIIILVQNRKNLSLDLIFLVTIFIGGFAFHILWEAKSRYIIPYIVVLMPVASIIINKFKFYTKQ